ncbi:hexokinase [Coemansia sp. RSA 2320]|nr:hexokinase [Coemansia sp. RSA 2320]
MIVLPTSTCALSDRQLAKLTQIERAFALSPQQLAAIVKSIHAKLFQGLHQNDNSCELPMTPTFVHQRTQPAGVSLGMAIEATGRRIRISSFTFAKHPTKNPSSTQVFVTPPAALKSAATLFEYTAYCLREFIQSRHLDSPQTAMPLGITIGLPVSGSSVSEQPKEDSLDLCGKNIARQLYDTFLRCHLPVRLTSFTNSTVSSLIASRHQHKDTKIAASFNHGINAAYFEPLANVKTLSPSTVSDGAEEKYVAVDTEIGRYTLLPLTQWDRRVDRESKHPGTRTLEKMIADRYLGELVRNLITDFIDERLLFVKADTRAISVEYSFHTAYMASIMESESAVDAIFAAEFGISFVFPADCQLVRALCELVAKRAAQLAAAMLAALVLKTRPCDSKPTVVALSGVLFDINQRLYDHSVMVLKSLLADKAALVEIQLHPRGTEVFGAAVNAASI